MVSEDSGCLHTMDPAIPAASVHGDCALPKTSESLCAQVLASLHRSHDGGEGLELLLFRAQKGRHPAFPADWPHLTHCHCTRRKANSSLRRGE